MKTYTLIRMSAAILAMAFSLGGCSSVPVAAPLADTGLPYEDSTNDSLSYPGSGQKVATGTDVGTGQTLRIGVPFDYPGIGWMDPETGIPRGFDVDIAAYLAWKLGYSPYDVEWVAAPADERVSMVRDGLVDFVVAPMTITPERAAEVDFAGPYLVTGQDLLVRANDDSINGVNDLTGKTLCLLPTTTGAERLQERFGNKVNIIFEDSYARCIELIISGEVDATSTDDAILAGLSAQDEYYRAVRLVGNTFSEEQYGIALPPDSHQLCLRINHALAEMVADGSWAKFISRNVDGTNYYPENYGNPPALTNCQ